MTLFFSGHYDHALFSQFYWSILYIPQNIPTDRVKFISKFMDLCSYHHNYFKNIFIPSKKILCPLAFTPHLSPAPTALGNN